mmetsp:Transcript_10335/g.24439  ORF Transcript_10335/g.24439 Transcript_10335/m.24439 type:complete len:209 (+) Transcript_10335:1179-1805(+)
MPLRGRTSTTSCPESALLPVDSRIGAWSWMPADERRSANRPDGSSASSCSHPPTCSGPTKICGTLVAPPAFADISFLASAASPTLISRKGTPCCRSVCLAILQYLHPRLEYTTTSGTLSTALVDIDTCAVRFRRRCSESLGKQYLLVRLRNTVDWTNGRAELSERANKGLWMQERKLYAGVTASRTRNSAKHKCLAEEDERRRTLDPI